MLSVLGPLRLDGAAGAVEVPGRKGRELLTLLALAAPRPLTAAALAGLLWDEPPPSAVKTVQAHVSRVRSALATAGAAGAVGGGPAGYQLLLDADRLDVAAVDELRRRARVRSLAGDDHGAEVLLRRARERWRGEPELPSSTGGEAERARLAEEHLALVEDHLAALVGASPAGAVGELDALTAGHPLRERLWALRMEALYRSGRQADALAAYRRVRGLLAAELGVEPGPELRALHAAVLAHALPARAVASPPEPPAVPADVPRYADAGGVHVAYGIFGAGPTDVLLLQPTFIPVDAYLEEPHLAGAMAGLAAGRRVIAFDRRGLGLSDPVTAAAPPTLTQWTQDAVAVLDGAGAGRVHVLANADTAMIALLLAAAHADRVATMTLVNGFSRMTSTADYPHGEPPTVDTVLSEIRTPDAPPAVDVLTWIAPSVAGDRRFRTWWDAVGRRGASPRTAELVHRLFVTADVRPVLPLVRVPVLLLSRLGCASYDPGHARHLLAHLPDATLAEHTDPDGPWFLGDVGWVLDRFAAFTGRDQPHGRGRPGG